MRKGLLVQWRRRIATRGLVTALLLAAPVAVAAEIGFSGGIGGLAGGLSTLASGPNTEPTSERSRDSTPARVAVAEATGGAPERGAPGGAPPETGEGEQAPTGGGDTRVPGDTDPGTGSNPGGGDTGGGGTPADDLPNPEPPPDEDPVASLDPIGSLVEGVGNTLDNLLGGGS